MELVEYMQPEKFIPNRPYEIIKAEMKYNQFDPWMEFIMVYIQLNLETTVKCFLPNEYTDISPWKLTKEDVDMLNDDVRKAREKSGGCRWFIERKGLEKWSDFDLFHDKEIEYIPSSPIAMELRDKLELLRANRSVYMQPEEFIPHKPYEIIKAEMKRNQFEPSMEFIMVYIQLNPETTGKCWLPEKYSTPGPWKLTEERVEQINDDVRKAKANRGGRRWFIEREGSEKWADFKLFD